MAIQIVDNFQVNIADAIDNRLVVGPSQFYTDKDDLPYKYAGMRVWDLNSGVSGVPYVWTGTTFSTEASSGIAGSGTPGVISKFIGGGNVLDDSIIKEVGVNIGIGTISPDKKLTVAGDIKSTGAGGFYGKGTNITDINANNITSGTLTLTRLQNGTTGYILTGGGGSPVWTNPTSITVGNSTDSDNILHTYDSSTTSYRQLTFLDTSTGTGYHTLRNSAGLSFKASNSSLNVAGSLGVGTSTQNPANTLYVNGSARINGNVGIGGYNSTYRLYVDNGRTWFDQQPSGGSGGVGTGAVMLGIFKNFEFYTFSNSTIMRMTAGNNSTNSTFIYNRATYCGFDVRDSTYFNTKTGSGVILFGGGENGTMRFYMKDRTDVLGGAGVWITKNLRVDGTVSKGAGTFQIDHPLPSKKDTHNLVHSFIEGPQADNIYRGRVNLVSGSATVNIDTVSDMTEGTFEALNTDTQCFTSNETGWGSVRGIISGNILTIECTDIDCVDTISWMVIGERKDNFYINSSLTDENGKLIVEPLKVDEIHTDLDPNKDKNIL